jgi:hypothetical protein
MIAPRFPLPLVAFDLEVEAEDVELLKGEEVSVMGMMKMAESSSSRGISWTGVVRSGVAERRSWQEEGEARSGNADVFPGKRSQTSARDRHMLGNCRIHKI